MKITSFGPSCHVHSVGQPLQLAAGPGIADRITSGAQAGGCCDCTGHSSRWWHWLPSNLLGSGRNASRAASARATTTR